MHLLELTTLNFNRHFTALQFCSYISHFDNSLSNVLVCGIFLPYTITLKNHYSIIVFVKQLQRSLSERPCVRTGTRLGTAGSSPADADTL